MSTIGCATIPPEAPELSVELGKRISAIEDANIKLLHKFFDQKRIGVDKFIENEWVPMFAEEIFSNPNISSAWDTIVKEDDKSQRLKFIIKTGSKLQERINKKRIEIIQPLDDLERKVEEKIRSEYTQARSINNSITSFLVSSSKISETRKYYLDMAGVSDQYIGSIIERTDSAVSELLNKTEDYNDKTIRVQQYLEKLKVIKDSI